MWGNERECVCVCACVRERVFVCVCVWVRVWVKEKREREGGQERMCFEVLCGVLLLWKERAGRASNKMRERGEKILVSISKLWWKLWFFFFLQGWTQITFNVQYTKRGKGEKKWNLNPLFPTLRKKIKKQQQFFFITNIFDGAVVALMPRWHGSVVWRMNVCRVHSSNPWQKSEVHNSSAWPLPLLM